MTFEEALELALQGVRVCRPCWGEDFALAGEGKFVRGRFLGETSFASVHPWEPSEADRTARDWKRFRRELPDEWEGCDAPLRG